MPFRSQAQRKWMHMHHPEMARRWEKETPKGPLPEHVKKAEFFEAFADELDKLGVRIGKVVSKKVPVVRKSRKPIAWLLKRLRGKTGLEKAGPTRRAIARAVQDPSPVALGAGLTAYGTVGGAFPLVPLVGTTSGATTMAALQTPRIFKLRKEYAKRIAKMKTKRVSHAG